MGHISLQVADNFLRLRSTLNSYHARVNSYKRSLYPRATARSVFAHSGFSTWRSFVKSALFHRYRGCALPAHLAPDPDVFELWTGVALELRPTSGEKVVSIHLAYRRKVFRSR